MAVQMLLVRRTSTKETTYDISQAVKQVDWSGQKYDAPRSIDVTFARPRLGNGDRVNVNNGDALLFKWNGSELFRGPVFSITNTDGQMTAKAYDNMVYLVKNSDEYVFKNKKASDIFRRIARDFGISVGTVADTHYVLPSVIYDGDKLYDMVQKAIVTTYQHNGERYYLRSEKGKMNLFRRISQTKQWVIEDGVNLGEYEYTQSIEDTITRIKLEYEEDGKKTLIATAKNTSLQNMYGILQYYEKVSDKTSQAKLNQKANSMLKSKGKVQRTFQLTDVLGIPDVISGNVVRVMAKDISVNKSYYIDEDTHTFIGKKHMMSLTLSETDELPEVDA